MRDLVDRLHAAGLAYAVESVFCDSKACVYSIALKSRSRVCRRCLVAGVRSWLDRVGGMARIEGAGLEIEDLQGLWPDAEAALIAEDVAALLGAPTVTRVRIARQLVEELEAMLEAA